MLNIDHYLLQLDYKLDTLNSKLELLYTIFSHHKQQSADELAQLQTSLNTAQSSLEQLHTTLSQHKQETEAELAQLHNNMRETITQLSTVHQELQTSTSHAECVDTEQSLELHQNLQDNLTRQLKDIQKDVTNILEPYTCGGTEGWRRIVNLDMNYPSSNCPSGWQLTGYTKRSCGRVNFGSRTCDSVTFPVGGGEYTRVCGRIKAYQWGATWAFFSYNRAISTNTHC